MKGKILALLIIFLISSLVYAEQLEISPILLKTVTKTDSTVEEFVKIKNLESNTASIQITTKNTNFKLSSYGFGMLPGEEKELKFSFYSRVPGVFINEFFIRSDEETVTLPVIIEVESAKTRFDSTVEILDAKRIYYPGDEVAFSFTVFDLFEFIATDIEIGYYILNMENLELYKEENTLNVKAQKTQTKKIKLSNDIKTGNYVLVIKSRQGTSIGYSTILFTVTEKPDELKEFNLKTFCSNLIKKCQNNGICIGVIISSGLLIIAALIIYIIEVVKLSNLPKKKIEKALMREEKNKKTLNLTKKILKESEEGKEEEKKEKIDEEKRKKVIEKMLLEQRKKEPSITEKKIFEMEVKKSKGNRQKFINDKREELKTRKKIKKLLKK